MSGKSLIFRSFTLPAAVAGLIALAGCDEQGEFQNPFSGAGAATSDNGAAPTGDMVERDVEAPEVFSVNEPGLWDGRPSLGGVWVAHPDVTDPERVIIRNEANGQFVIGALFRRERDNPGPALQVSSDAAEELGVLAGAPTMLNVVALRRQEAPALPADTATTEFDESPEVQTATLDPVADSADVSDIATAAISLAEAAEAGTTVPVPVAAPAAAPAPASSLDRPYIQIGIFSVEANAERTADQLRGSGLAAQVLAQESNGRPFWRVTVGPAPNAADRDAVLAQVKGLGFNDAYAVTN